MLLHLITPQNTIYIRTNHAPRLDEANPHRGLAVVEAFAEQLRSRDGAVPMDVLDELEFLALVVTLLRRRHFAVAGVVSLLVLVDRLQIVVVALVADIGRADAPTPSAMLELQAALQRQATGVVQAPP